ncbi:unnamed protein product, partial [Mesorhabditis belari]|uniref:Uncharacterized protein n=1 Tax=Mesorhabditis belari TaxID=2138241 RepID=A0AAF3EIL5_9BILA
MNQHRDGNLGGMETKAEDKPQREQRREGANVEKKVENAPARHTESERSPESHDRHDTDQTEHTQPEHPRESRGSHDSDSSLMKKVWAGLDKGKKANDDDDEQREQ